MAANEPIENSLHNLLNCNICQKEVDELKALPCQHTICLSCAKQLPVFKNRFNCSLCHQEHPVPNGGFKHLPDSLVGKQLKDLIKQRVANNSEQRTYDEDKQTRDDENSQTTDADKQTSGTDKQTSDADKQTTDADKQTSGTDKQTSDADKQTSNADKQTSGTDKQTSDADKLTSDADKQAYTEGKQTYSANISVVGAETSIADGGGTKPALQIAAGGFGYVPATKAKSETKKASKKKPNKNNPKNAGDRKKVGVSATGETSTPSNTVTQAAIEVDMEMLKKDLFETLEMGKSWCRRADEMTKHYQSQLKVLPKYAKSTKEIIIDYKKKTRQQCQEKLRGLDQGLIDRIAENKVTLESVEPYATQIQTVLDSVPRSIIAKLTKKCSRDLILKAQDGLQKLQAINTTVKALPADVETFNRIKPGQLVRILPQAAEDYHDSQLEKFVKGKVTHSSIGIYRGACVEHGVNPLIPWFGPIKISERPVVIFPEQIDWSGPEGIITRCPGKINLPFEGDKVKVKPSVTKPHFSWNGVRNKRSCGVLVKIKDVGPGNDLEVIVNFPENSSWRGLYSEVEMTPACGLEIGDKVWVSRAIPEPSRGWAGVNGSSVGKVKHIEGAQGQEEVTVDFPQCNDWIGLATELEMVREPQKGEKIQVKLSVNKPHLGWGGASHDDVGILEEKEDMFQAYGRIGYVTFPGKPRCPFVIDDIEPARYEAPSYEDDSGFYFSENAFQNFFLQSMFNSQFHEDNY